MSSVPPQLLLPYGPPISLDLAKRIMASAEGEAVANHWPMVIAIVDSGGQLVMPASAGPSAARQYVRGSVQGGNIGQL